MTQNIDIISRGADGRLAGKLISAIGRTRDYFLRAQSEDGYWWGELESNSTMEAEYIMLCHYLASDEGQRISMVAEDIRRRQTPDGGWAMYHGAPSDLSTTIECYFALKLAGDLPSDAHMNDACAFIKARGGLRNARVFTKIWLALFGQWDWADTPVMQPEFILIPSWAPFSIYRFAYWARATIVPLTVILTLRPTRPVAGNLSLQELHCDPHLQIDNPNRSDKTLGLEQVFRWGERFLRLYDKQPIKPLRKRSLKKVEEWVIEHQEADGSWGGIQPPWVYSLMALSALGHPNDDPVIAKGLAGFRGSWSRPSQDGRALRIQACLSPVWDTGLALMGLLESGIEPNHPSVQKAIRWLLREEIRVPGDWAVKAPKVAPSGWAFEFENDLYPDIDDTSIVVMDLMKAELSDQFEESNKGAAIDRAVQWLIGMQSANGGWAAFDKDNTSAYLAQIPFSDFGEVIDPPSADVTGHILEMFGGLGWASDLPFIQKAIDYLWSVQEEDGAWFGRWGVNYVYGCGAVIPGLKAIGQDMAQPRIRLAVAWLFDHQNPDGGWGESCASYADPSLRGRGISTASQTAWALIALIAAEEAGSEEVRRGLEWLVDTQNHDGTWEELEFTGCGFPGYGIGDQPNPLASSDASEWPGHELGAAFMINYHLYRNYFPLWAMGRYLKQFGYAGISKENLSHPK